MTKTTKATRMSKAAIAANLEKLRKDIALAVESANTMRDRIQHALVGCVSHWAMTCLLYTSPSPRDKRQSRMPSSA